MSGRKVLLTIPDPPGTAFKGSHDTIVRCIKTLHIVMCHIHYTMYIKCISKSSPRSLRNISPVFSTGVFYRFEITKSSHLCCVVINLLFCNQFRQVHYIFSGTNFFTICILHCLVVYQFCQDFPIFRGTEDNGGNSLGGETSSMT